MPEHRRDPTIAAICLLLRFRDERLDEHLAKLLELLRAPDFIGEERQAYDVEKVVIELVGLI